MSKTTHYRRCHCCGRITQKEERPVERCRFCNKSLAPFFYFDDRSVAVPSDCQLRPPSRKGEFNPILGLTVYWDSF